MTPTRAPGQLPVRDRTVNAAVLVDAFCFPRELDRVLTPTGAVVWINLLGEDGPLYLPSTDIAACLGGSWTTVESRAGWGIWAILRRSAACPRHALGFQHPAMPSEPTCHT
ncbi:hypothetical protein [Streptosporangium roseum]|uniref:hypothetical protein n=1 Tax=Streptosporangium roseum TaxID=2001 RepID=UPI0034446BBB